MALLSTEQRLARLDVRLEELDFWRVRAAVDLDRWTFDGDPIALGQTWPSRDGHPEGPRIFAHPTVTLPADWPLEHTRLVLDLGGEGLVRLRYGNGGEEAFGLDPYHQLFPLRDCSVAVEAAVVARLPFGVPNRGARLERARLVQMEPELVRLMRQLWLVTEAVRSLDAHEVVSPLLDAAERALAALDWPSATSTYLARTAQSSLMLRLWSMPEHLDPQPDPLTEEQRASVAAAANRLDRELTELRDRYPPSGALALTGQAHLDLAWLWPLDETRRKAQRTYSTVVALMDRYAEFRFHQTSAQVYAFLEQDDPALFARIQERAAAGQWEPIGGMWVEPDINMPCGESLVRQLLYGQRYFRQKFGATHSVCWLPDTFGFSPALPQLLLGAGIENFFTTKLNWSETNTFPYDLFWWEGLDGSRVLAHTFDNSGSQVSGLSGYNGDPSPSATVSTWRNYRAKHLNPESLLSIGYGDGGGGPTAEMIEQARELASFPALPALRFCNVAEYYRRAREALAGRELPVWVGELYLELHRGTLTTQGRTKYLHRRAERTLIAAEVLAAMDVLLGGDEPVSLEPPHLGAHPASAGRTAVRGPAEDTRRQWRVLLRNQFHDILPGSSIREVYQTAEAELSSVLAEAESVIHRYLSRWAERSVSPGNPTLGPKIGRPGLLVVNPDLSPRPLRLELAPDTPFPGAQAVEGGSVLSGSQVVPGLGASVVLTSAPMNDLRVSSNQLENAFLRVTLAGDGSLASVYDKRADREVLADRGNQLWAYVDKPRSWDAWDIESGSTPAGEVAPNCMVAPNCIEVGPPDSIEVCETGPHRAAIRIERRFRQSRIRQDVRLWANSARLEFKTTLDWHDRRWLLKARFPLAVRSSRATFETAFGIVERPTHRNTSWDAARFEVAAHRFVDLSEPGYGVALLNDGKYGHHALGNELGLSLLRSPTYPDPFADEGLQTFTYALYPHAGNLATQGQALAGVLMEAEDLNRPLLVHPCTAEEEASWQALRLDGLPLGLGALKPLEDGEGLVLRTYEPQGARGTVNLELPPGWKLDAELSLLEESLGDANRYFTPFQVHSWLLKRTERSSHL